MALVGLGKLISRCERQLSAAGAGLGLAFASVTVAAAARVASPLLGELADAALWLSGSAWILGWGLFAVLYFPVLTGPRPPPD